MRPLGDGDGHGATTTTSVAVPEGFRPVDAGTQQRDGAVLMVAAYIVVWAILMGFVLAGRLRQRRLDARIARLERAMERMAESP